MTTLHIVRQSAFNTSDFAQCLQVLGQNDVIVFIDDGCYNLHHTLIHHIESHLSIQLKVMTPHAQARAINIEANICEGIVMKDLIELTFEHNRVITWQ